MAMDTHAAAVGSKPDTMGESASGAHTKPVVSVSTLASASVSASVSASAPTHGGTETKAGTLNVRWAPLDIPLPRRLQTAALLFAGAFFPFFMLLNVALLFYQPLAVGLGGRYFLLVYIAWQILFDRNTPRRGGRMIMWVRRFPLWKYVAAYFPAQLHTPYAPNGYSKDKPYIFCLHPHGIISISAICNLIIDANSPVSRLGVDYRVATVSFNFLVPLWRDLIMALGFVVASRGSIAWLLKQKKAAMIVIGGAQETLEAQPGSADLVLAKRKGFIRLALRHGATLVPVYHFGENELFTQATSPFLRALQRLAIRVFGFTMPLFRGRGIFQYDLGILPRRIPLHTVVGPEIPVPHIPNPSDADIDEYHRRYIDALKQLYNDNKDKYYFPTDFYGRPLPTKALNIVA